MGKKKAQTVYLITSGSYSDYRVNYVFLTLEKAEAWIDLHRSEGGYSEYDVEHFDAQDDEPLAEVFDVLTVEYCYLSDPTTAPTELVSDGWPREYTRKYIIDELVESTERILSDSYKFKEKYNSEVPTYETSTGRIEGSEFGFKLVGTDHERIRKTASERMARIRANSELLDHLYGQLEGD